MSIRYVNQAGASLMIIATEKVIFRVDYHVRSRYWNVFVPGDVHARRVIHAVIKVSRYGKGRHGTLCMVCDIGDIWREEGLILFVHSHGDISPPQKCLDEWSAVIQLSLGFYDAFPRMQRNPDHTFHPVHWFVFAEPDRAAPVFVLLNLVIHRHKCGRSVVLRPVELHPAGNPRPQQAYERWFDNVLPVKEIEVIGLVLPDVNPSADLRQDHDAEEFIL